MAQDVLIVDDSATLRRMVKKTMEMAGLDVGEVYEASNGIEAVKQTLENVPPDFPPTVIVQHMPEGFTKSFAERLDHFSPLAVSEAVDGDRLLPGKVLLARGGRQMTVQGTPGYWRIAYGSDEPFNRHCPSVDVLFDSVARLSNVQTVGILLTGMGADGAQGLLRMRQAGAVTVAQNRESCVVYGMPQGRRRYRRRRVYRRPQRRRPDGYPAAAATAGKSSPDRGRRRALS